MSGAAVHPASVRLELDAIGQAAWERLFDAIPDSVLEQSWTYGEAVRLAAGRSVSRGLIISGEAPVGLVQVFTHKFFGCIAIPEILRGPVFLPEASENEKRAAHALVRQQWPRGIVQFPRWMPELPDTPEAHSLLRQLGVRQVVTGYPTVLVDLTASTVQMRAGLDGKWRNALSQAEKSGLKVKFARGGKAVEKAVRHYDAMRRKRRFSGPSGVTATAFHQLVRRQRDLLAVTVSRGSDVLSGALFLGHGQTATYYMGWTAKAGRAVNSQNLALWRGMLKLSEDGFTSLDMGGVDTWREPGIARFKIGTGGRVHMTAGTWM